MRSVAEIRFRVRQEASNVWLLLFSPSLPDETASSPELKLPPREEIASYLRGSALAERIEALADSFCAHRFPILGSLIDTGPEIRWRRDYARGVESGLDYFRRIPYLNAALAGDHKVIWELNRHQHLVVLAQAWLLNGRTDCIEEIASQLESWWDQNPFQRGINWTSALEVAFRALSWIHVWHLASPALPGACARRLLNELYRHGVHLEQNLSVYFAPNTHLLGEAVVLHALGALFPQWPGAARWKSEGGRITAEQMTKQVRPDGSHFEQSSAYHVYAMDLFLFHALLEPAGPAYRDRLRQMADYLTALSSSDGLIPLLGDDDGGRLFHPHGNRRRFGAATLATCSVYFGRDDWPHLPADLCEQAAWWSGGSAFQARPGSPASPQARLFPEAGVAVLSSGPAHIVADTRGFGFANAGHSHAHALHFVCRSEGRDILIDPGTYTYVGEPEWRERFRGTAFHNTITIDGLNQAEAGGPFRWNRKPACEILRWNSNSEWTLLDAVCAYRGFRHRRLLLWVPRLDLIAVADAVSGSDSDSHDVEQIWHCGEAVTTVSPGNYRIGADALLALSPGSLPEVREGWQSELPGFKVPRPVIVAKRKTELPVVLGAVLLAGAGEDLSVSVEACQDGIRIDAGLGRVIELPMSGDPIIRLIHPGGT